MPELIEPHRAGTPGRIDKDGIEWWACDPYPTWYRWSENKLYTKGYGKWEELEDA